MKKKTCGLLVNLILYIVAFAVGIVPFCLIDDILLAEATLTMTATLVIYVVTCFVPDTSLYDPYWSVAPPVMIAAAMIKYGLCSANALILLLGVIVWSVRLTVNWAVTYKGLLQEDWRYSQFRAKYGKLGFALINFVGLQYVPTIVVYAGLIAAFYIIQTEGFDPLILVGITIMLTGVVFETIADSSLKRFVRENSNRTVTCDISLWRYSRHPNYLGEIMFWTGIFVSFILIRPDIWYCGLGIILIVALFTTVSIPMMEKHNSERRSDYENYKRRTSVLLLMPPRKI